MMPLVQYSDSDSSDTPQPDQAHSKSQSSRGIKRKHDSKSESSTLPPLPDSFHDLYASTARISKQDDPTLHAGRQRVTPHVEGSWPTHVYVEWFPSTEYSSRLSDVLTDLSNAQTPQEHQVHSLLRSELGAELPLHISLSRPIVLLTHQRQPFVDTLTRAISKTNISPFEVAVRGFEWVANYEKTRWFLALKLERAPQNGLNKLLHLSNQTVTDFGQPPLYTNSLQSSADAQSRKRQAGNGGRSKGTTRAAASSSMSLSGPSSDMDMSSSFHISIGWTLSAPTESLRERLNTTGIDFQAIKVDVNTVKAKIGNGITVISLAKKIDTLNKIIESKAAAECVSEEALVHLKSYKYSSVDKSLISHYILRHYWNAFVEVLPLWLAPNMVTLLGFLFILTNVICLEIWMPDLVGPGPSWLYYSFAVGLWMYSTMDNVDGKQARRTGQSSGLGELFDHGIDSLNCTLASLCETAAMALGPTPKGVFTALIPCLPMFFSTWETYHTHTLYLGYFNGPTEGLILACTVMILSGYYGPQMWHHPISDLVGYSGIIGDNSMIDLWIPIILGTFFVAHLPACVYNVVKARREQGLPVAPVFLEWAPIVVYTASIGAWLYSPYSTLMRENRLVLFCLTMSFVFGRMTTKIILAHLTRQPFPYWTVMLIPLIGGAVLGNLPRIGLSPVTAEVELWYLRAYFVFAMVVYFRWALLVINSICAYLGINCLTITKKPAPGQATVGEKSASNGVAPEKHVPNGRAVQKGD